MVAEQAVMADLRKGASSRAFWCWKCGGDTRAWPSGELSCSGVDVVCREPRCGATYHADCSVPQHNSALARIVRRGIAL